MDNKNLCELVVTLARSFVEQPCNHFEFEQATILAQCEIELDRIKRAKTHILAEAENRDQTSVTFNSIIAELARVERYEKATFSRRSRAIKLLNISNVCP